MPALTQLLGNVQIINPFPPAGITVSTGFGWDLSKPATLGDPIGTTDSQVLTNKTISTGSTWSGTRPIPSSYVDIEPLLPELCWPS